MKQLKRNNPAVARKSQGRRWRSALIVISAVIALVLIGSGIAYYQVYVAPFRQVVLTVDNQAVHMDYFLKRTRMANNNPTATLQQLTYEQIVKKMAPQYGIAVSPSDVEMELRKEAGNTTTNTISETAFQEWYRGILQTTRLSDTEYREIVKIDLMAAKFTDYLASELPTKAEQIHLNAMTLATLADAINAKARINAGENFSAVAVQLSLDSQTKSNRGDLGWIPRGVTPYDDVVFPLALGQVSDPVSIDPNSKSTSQYILFMVSEKQPDRAIGGSPMQVLRSRALYNFILQQIPQHVKYSYTQEDQEWVAKQLAAKS